MPGLDVKTSWGNLSPYADALGFGISQGYPVGCELSQVHVLHRHGQRYPTEWDGGSMEKFAQKLGNYSKKNPDRKVGIGPLEFLHGWEYTLGLDMLLPTGAATESTSGALFWSMYGHLLYRAGPGDAKYDSSLNVYPNGTVRPKPIFRSTSQPRILESARWWLSGFFSDTDSNSSEREYDLTIIPEQNNFNSTLSPTSSCKNGSFVGFSAAEAFSPALTNGALKRLSKFLPDDFDLDAMDVSAMFSLCPYEYAALGRSSFCSLFTEQEWRDFQYSLDLAFYGSAGFGSPSGRAHGIGYVQELAARLESRLIISSESSINYTYDDNTKDFPLGQLFYMDMSHDDVIISTLTALGLNYFNAGLHGLSTSVPHAPSHNRFNMNQVAPFGARLFSEVWTCPKGASLDRLQEKMYKNPDLSSQSDTTGYVRFVLNNAPVSVDGLCDNAVNGFCSLGAFLRQVPNLTKEAMYQEACFGNYNITTQVSNGQPIPS
ncbi:hypothetical protein N7481_001672 [Penicillium waksmanii]|uniref:uncharacterized protein n=1 Tax=Penicillium waksmanii TaxID=69791 RepID=UPI00254877CF|nr:uncharacterized protein N7481_001672 [Penicillium waksmanii]KAJ5994695.1 hypothetical protein N7481_001672 [Penicillium waksmanii]